MTNETIQQLQALGLDPKIVEAGIRHEKSDNFYKGAEFIKEKHGFKLFRTTQNGHPRMLAQEQMIVIFG